MPVEVQVDPAANIVTYTAKDDVTFAEMSEAYEGVFAHPDFRANMNAICDARNARIAVSIPEIPKLIELLKSHQQKRGRGYRVAIVVSGSPDFGLSTMFEMQTYSLPFDVRVLRSFTEAKEWLAEQS